MKHTEAAHILLNAWFEQIGTLDATNEEIHSGLSDAKHIFDRLHDYFNPRETLTEMLNSWLQPTGERTFLKRKLQDKHKNNYIRLQGNGLGLNIDNETQIELLQLLDDECFDPVKFGKYFGKLLEPHIVKYKKLKKSKGLISLNV